MCTDTETLFSYSTLQIVLSFCCCFLSIFNHACIVTATACHAFQTWKSLILSFAFSNCMYKAFLFKDSDNQTFHQYFVLIPFVLFLLLFLTHHIFSCNNLAPDFLFLFFEILRSLQIFDVALQACKPYKLARLHKKNLQL